MTKDLTLHYERKLYMVADTPENRRLINKFVEVFQFIDGRIELRVGGKAIPCSVFDKLGEIDQGQIVDNWAAAGFMDTLIRWKMEPEVAHGYAKGLYERVQG